MVNEKLTAENYRLRDQVPGNNTASKKALLPGASDYGIGEGEVYAYGHQDVGTQTNAEEDAEGAQRSVTGKGGVRFQDAGGGDGEGKSKGAGGNAGGRRRTLLLDEDGLPLMSAPKVDELVGQSKKLCPLMKIASELKGKPKLSVESALNTLHDLYVGERRELPPPSQTDAVLRLHVDPRASTHPFQDASPPPPSSPPPPALKLLLCHSSATFPSAFSSPPPSK